jgi:hypothetical protein
MGCSASRVGNGKVIGLHCARNQVTCQVQNENAPTRGAFPLHCELSSAWQVAAANAAILLH